MNDGKQKMSVVPYYEDESVTIYHGDCREILPTLPSCDLLLTDPPYGIASIWQGGGGHGWGKARAQTAERNEWDENPPTEAELKFLLSKAKDAVIWGGNYFALPPARGWLVWNKPERNFTMAEAELAWTTRDAVIRVRDLPRSEAKRIHPTQKPLSLMRWCLSFFPDAKTVLDPYMGSGTTLRAARDEGKRAIGIEMDERWCEAAVKRLAQGSLFEEAV